MQIMPWSVVERHFPDIKPDRITNYQQVDDLSLSNNEDNLFCQVVVKIKVGWPTFLFYPMSKQERVVY